MALAGYNVILEYNILITPLAYQRYEITYVFTVFCFRDTVIGTDFVRLLEPI